MFNKDILLVDIESTGLDPHTHEILQIGAVLLDKKTLRIKQEFMTYIRPQHWARRSKVAMSVNKISWEKVKDAPSLKTVLTKLHTEFDPSKVVIGNYGPILDIEFLKAGYRTIKKPYPFEYHVFNVWPLCWLYASQHKLLRNKTRHAGFSLEDLMKHFGIEAENRHDALADTQVTAEILRRIIHGNKRS